VADVVWTLVVGVTGLSAYAISKDGLFGDAPSPPPSTMETAIVVSAAVLATAIPAASAGYGFTLEARCERLDADPSYAPIASGPPPVLICDGSERSRLWTCNVRRTFRARCNGAGVVETQQCADRCVEPSTPSGEATCEP
jgi:hypothetical protein